jgi:hypothetical protein
MLVEEVVGLIVEQHHLQVGQVEQEVAVTEVMGLVGNQQGQMVLLT